ncbi:MAG: tyrosine--tRNA ligase [Candidatus Handelsmanbacteria bacterium]|nr:tyrosine--tRNA ligase [Candidatus Handelsmanbacteria bacterium]
MKLLDDLEFRGLIYQMTDREGLAQRLEEGALTLYNGFDPTAESLHVGSLLPILVLRRFQLAGHRPIAVVGGGTGLIGDPSGKVNERSLNSDEVVAEWTGKLKAQLETFLDFSGARAARIVNNYDWLGPLKAIELLREVGKHFPVPYMLAKDSVASRLETGISFTEFSYMILQAYDFLVLNQNLDCQLQIGGSDQWGNITAGADLIRRAAGRKAHGLTFPLVTKADGTKFGKTEGGAVWLDPAKTTPYQFYQFWVNADDQSVVTYLKYFTFLEREELLAMEETTRTAPAKREAQRRLAEEVTTLVHGEAATQRAQQISRALFYGEVAALSADEIEEGFGDVPSHLLEGEEEALVELLVKARVCASKRQAREDLDKGAIYLNGERCTEGDKVLRRAEGLHGRYHIIRRGKNKYYLIR